MGSENNVIEKEKDVALKNRLALGFFKTNAFFQFLAHLRSCTDGGNLLRSFR